MTDSRLQVSNIGDISEVHYTLEGTMKAASLLPFLLSISFVVAAADEARESPPPVEAINLVAAFEGPNLQKLDGGDWWLDTKERAWKVTRQVAPGVLDTTHKVVVSYVVAGQIRKSWSVDLREKKVESLPIK